MTFEEFASTQLGVLRRFAWVLTNDRGLGEDLVQDVLLKAHRQWDRIGRVDEPRAYVRRMLVNEFVSWRRKWARVVPRSDVDVLVDELGGPDHAGQHAERAALVADIARLPRRQRAVIVLRYFADLPDNEIADILGCTPGTVRSQALRALRTLRVLRTDVQPLTDVIVNGGA